MNNYRSAAFGDFAVLAPVLRPRNKAGMWLASSLAAGVFLLVSASAAQPRTDTAAYKMMAHVTSNNELQQMSAASFTRARRDGFVRRK